MRIGGAFSIDVTAKELRPATLNCWPLRGSRNDADVRQVFHAPAERQSSANFDSRLVMLL